MSLSKSWDLQIDPSVFKILNKIPKRDAEAILKVIKLLPVDPYFGDIQKMKGKQGAWRRRIGAYNFL